MKVYLFKKLNQLLSYIGASHVYEITRLDNLDGFVYESDEIIQIPDDEFFFIKKNENAIAVLDDGDDLYLIEPR